MVEQIPTDIDRTPYLRATRELDGRQAQQNRFINRLWISNFALVLCTASAIAWAYYQSTIPRNIPFPLLINDLGETVATGFRRNANTNFDKVRQDRIQLFVEDFRSVTTDYDQQNQRIMRVWYLVQADSPAYKMMDHFFQEERNPLQHAQTAGPIRAQVSSVLLSPTGPTYTVEWTETQYDRKGLITGTDRWRGEFSFVEGPSTTNNPLGVYINAVSWTKFREVSR